MLLSADKKRYGEEKIPLFQMFMRLKQETKNPILKIIYKICFVYFRNRLLIEMSVDSNIDAGAYFGHPFCININPHSKIGKNCNIHKGVTIGQENRGVRKGAPTIGNEVWIGVNATIVGKISIGNDVLIEPNTYVNCDIPSHSIVFGNPCIIKHNDRATEGYINRKI